MSQSSNVLSLPTKRLSVSRKSRLMQKPKNKYFCKACAKEVFRDYDKLWTKSFCEKTGKNTRIYRVKP